MNSASGAELTVAICTLNRKDFILRCLSALQPQLTQFPLVELVVVDNGCNDDTEAAVLALGISGLRYVHEPALGLSNARNRALACCDREYLVFLDDDGYPAEGWLASVVSALTLSPDVFGGPFIPYYLQAKPSWFDDRFGSAHQDDEPGWKPFGYSFSGGNMGWRTAYLRQFGGFDPALGMQGGRLRLGEETALQVRLEARDNRRLLIKDMLLIHYVAPEKMTLHYVFMRAFSYGEMLHVIDPSSPYLSKGLFEFLRDVRFFLPLLLHMMTGMRNRSKRYMANFFSLHGMFIGVVYHRLASVIAERRAA